MLTLHIYVRVMSLTFWILCFDINYFHWVNECMHFYNESNLVLGAPSVAVSWEGGWVWGDQSKNSGWQNDVENNSIQMAEILDTHNIHGEMGHKTEQGDWSRGFLPFS